ncbi:hypothetical protein GCM10027347_50900 [Larkinella harenae]
MKKFLLTLLFVSIWGLSTAQTKPDTLALIESIFQQYKSTAPGCQLAISRNGQLIFSHAWGLADLEHQVPLTTQSIIEAGSVSKQFTAAAILLLEQQGKLALSDDVRKYIPELPDYKTRITLGHLMHHTSGIKDWGNVMALSDWPRGTKTYSNQDVLAILSRQKTLNHQPGEEYLYSNSNYVLFAIIVERVSGQSLADFTRSAIFEPAGMKHTQWRTDPKKIVPGRAIAYGKNDNTYFSDMPNESVYGNGGLLTTAEDLLRWNTYYGSGKLGDPSLLARQLSTMPLNNGRTNAYGAGLRIDSIRGWQVIMHDGATAGYRSTLEYYPALGLSIAWLANTSEFDGKPDGTGQLRKLFLVNRSSESRPKKPDTLTVATEKLARYTGWYRDLQTGSELSLVVKAGKLATNQGEQLTPIAENEFRLGSDRITIQPNRKQRLLYKTGTNTRIYEAAEPALVNQKALEAYTGDYYSDEVDAKLRIYLQSGKLIIHRYSDATYTLLPTYKDAFAIQNSSVKVYFDRDKGGRIINLKFTTPRVRNVAFKKLPQNGRSCLGRF